MIIARNKLKTVKTTLCLNIACKGFWEILKKYYDCHRSKITIPEHFIA